MQKISLINIYKVFLKIGAILLGGGYVIVPIMKNELIEKRNWITEEELCDYYCVSQCLPGIIAVNISILVGCRLLKTKGAFVALLGMATSPFLAIILIANLLNKILQFSFMEGIFWGVNLSVIVLIYLTLKEMWQKSIVDKFTGFWFLLIFILMLFKINPAFLIIGSIFFGAILQIIKDKKNA